MLFILKINVKFINFSKSGVFLHFDFFLEYLTKNNKY
ncbi:Uncharacterised protein [Escherichia coli]|nr:Uncharacterised protein [Escherichia coli]CAD5881756.1 Uncharacterised protein [Escherichia coli]CAD6120909.1 Uncharacterised protein [Escherichia coli]